jgi:subtilisin family serine protease
MRPDGPKRGLERNAARMLSDKILRPLLVAAAFVLCAAAEPPVTGAGGGVPDRRIVQVPPGFDRDHDRVADSLEQRVAAGRAKVLAGTQSLDLLVALDHRPSAADRDAAAKAGARLLGSDSELVYALRVALPAPGGDRGKALRRLAAMPGVVLIEENTIGHATCYHATRQTGARRVWTSYGFLGQSDTSIAVLDTGLDDTHPDFAADKWAAWKDFAGADYLVQDESPARRDFHGHGTAVASLACGSGAAAGMATETGQLAISEGRSFTPTWEYCDPTHAYPMPFPVNTTGYADSQTVEGRVYWKDADPGYTVSLCLMNEAMQHLPGALACRSWASDGDQPLVAYGTVAPGVNSFNYFALPCADQAGASPGSAYWLQVRTPMSPAGDGQNLMAGVAAQCRVVAVKVLDDNGLTNAQIVIQGLEWVRGQRVNHHIVAANMSFDFETRNTTVETAVNNLSIEGVVCVAAAGNRRSLGGEMMTSPAKARRCITVASISDQDAITSYSSPGDSDSHKPDLAAPGGSILTQRAIVAADSNDGERNYDPATGTEWFEPDDFFPNDYAEEYGTSMSAPQVAGAAALMAQAMGKATLTGDEALRIKMLLLMTATETNQQAEVEPDPVLNRASAGGWDRSEGYGRLNIDAAIKAAVSPCEWPSIWRATLGPGADQARAWARQITLNTGLTHQITLTNPPGADFDLYLYAHGLTADGLPTVVAASTSAGTGGTETLAVTLPADSERSFYLVVKRVSGTGEFTLRYRISSPTLAVGWNLISLPLAPVSFSPPEVFSGIPVDQRLFRYDPATQSYIVYSAANPDAFGSCDSHHGYWLYLDLARPFSYEAALPSCDPELDVSLPGWHLIGDPVADLPIADYLIEDTASGEQISFGEAVQRGWVGCPFYGWSTSLVGYTTHCLSGPPVEDSDRLSLWHGYWMNTAQPDLSLIMPRD